MRNRFAVFIKVFFIDLQSLTQRFGLRLFEESLLANRVIERAVGSDFQLFICGGNVHCGKQRVIGRFSGKGNGFVGIAVPAERIQRQNRIS